MTPDLTWKTSSHSDGLQCVEVARDEPSGDVMIRHSHQPEAGTLRFSAGEWSAFTTGIRAGEQLP